MTIKTSAGFKSCPFSPKNFRHHPFNLYLVPLKSLKQGMALVASFLDVPGHHLIFIKPTDTNPLFQTICAAQGEIE